MSQLRIIGIVGIHPRNFDAPYPLLHRINLHFIDNFVLI
jgi:hypothetical protein